MITVKITELGNNTIGFQVFNQYNERITSLSKMKPRDKKKTYIDKLKKQFIASGQSVVCNDLTIL
ncbi:MAG: hypothetical protein Q7R95_11550 [bacterium]|nr:hypothetical protein [bacterium]